MNPDGMVALLNYRVCCLILSTGHNIDHLFGVIQADGTTRKSSSCPQYIPHISFTYMLQPTSRSGRMVSKRSSSELVPPSQHFLKSRYVVDWARYMVWDELYIARYTRNIGFNNEVL